MRTFTFADTWSVATSTRRWSWRIRNDVDRFHLAIDVIDRVPRIQTAAAHLKEWLKGQIIDSINYAYSEGIDRPEIRNWTWPLGKQDAIRG